MQFNTIFLIIILALTCFWATVYILPIPGTTPGSKTEKGKF